MKLTTEVTQVFYYRKGSSALEISHTCKYPKFIMRNSYNILTDTVPAYLD